MIISTLILVLGAQAAIVSPSDRRTLEGVTCASGSVTLAGTLTLPSGAGPHPTVVLISGSGRQDRDGESREIPGYRPFAVIAEHLTRNGFAVFRYDDRGVGNSSGDYLGANESDFIHDAQAAVACLLARKDVAGNRIGLIGHSEGSLIAASVAGNDRRVAFVISLAGGAVDGYSLLVRQAEREFEAAGTGKEEVARLVEESRLVYDLARARKWEELHEVVGAITLKRLRALPKERTESLGDLEAFARERAAGSVKALQLPRVQFLLGHDFGKDWEKVSVPVLALYGELDVQVDAGQNIPALEQALSRAKNANLTSIVIPGANHLFLKAVTGSMAEYATLPRDFAPGFLDAILSWLGRNSNGPGLQP